MRIAIDARTLRTSTGRYVERLIHYLQKIDNRNDYIILLKPKDMDSWRSCAQISCILRWFSSPCGTGPAQSSPPCKT